MPRQCREPQIECGIITPTVAAEVTSHSRSTIRNWIKKDTIKAIRMNGSSEVRVSSLELMLMLINDCWPFQIELATAAYNYAKNFQPDHLEYTKEIIRTFGTISPHQRKEIKLVLSAPEVPAWDASGNIIPVTNNQPVQLDQAKEQADA